MIVIDRSMDVADEQASPLLSKHCHSTRVLVYMSAKMLMSKLEAVEVLPVDIEAKRSL